MLGKDLKIQAKWDHLQRCYSLRWAFLPTTIQPNFWGNCIRKLQVVFWAKLGRLKEIRGGMRPRSPCWIAEICKSTIQIDTIGTIFSGSSRRRSLRKRQTIGESWEILSIFKNTSSCKIKSQKEKREGIGKKSRSRKRNLRNSNGLIGPKSSIKRECRRRKLKEN